MNFRGFDTARIRALADQMKALGPGARRIHGDLAGVLFEAQELLGGKPATTSPLLQPLIGQVMPLFYTGMPAAVQQEFDSTSASMKRRCDVLDGCRQLELRGYAVDPSMLFDDEAAAPDPGKIVDALAYFNQHIDDAGGFLWSNPAQGAQEVLDKLKSLTPAELDAFVNALTPAQAQELNAQLGEGSSWWGAGDPDQGVREQWGNLLLLNVGPEALAKAAQLVPNLGLEPDLRTKYTKGLVYQPVNGTLFGPNGVDIKHDLVQGQDGDCWFLSSLAAIAERDPGFFARHIRENANGTYTVTFYQSPLFFGEPPVPVEVTVDNQLPSGPNGPAYAQTPGGVMWVAIYEKAYAQFRGGYENIDGGWGDVGLHDLTGQPTQRLDAGDTSLAEIDQKIRDDFAVTSGSKSDDSRSSNEFTDGDLIVTSHEYSVERVDMNSHPPTITLLNPWGSAGQDSATGLYIPQEITLTEDEWHTYFNEVGVTKTRV